MFLELNCLETLFIMSLKTVEWLGLQWQWVDTTFILLVKYRVKAKFPFYLLMNNFTDFSFQWCLNNVVCYVVDRLYFSPVMLVKICLSVTFLVNKRNQIKENEHSI